MSSQTERVTVTVTVTVAVMLMRDKAILLRAGEDGTHALPFRALTAGETLRTCALNVAKDAGLATATEICFQRLAPVAGSDGATEIRVGLVANAPLGAEPAPGFAFCAVDALPALDPATAAAIDACKSEAIATDLDGSPLPARMWPPNREAPTEARPLDATPADPPSDANDVVEPSSADGPPAAEIPVLVLQPPLLGPPSPLVAGLWFGGALAWATSIFLALEWVRSTRGPATTVAWMAAVATAWTICTRAGTTAAGAGGPPFRRFAQVLAWGGALLGILVVAVGFLGGRQDANEAYAILCVAGMLAFFVGREIAWRRLQDTRVLRTRILQRLGWVALVLASFVALLRAG